MMQEPILIGVSDGRTKVFSLNTNQEVYIIDQRGSNIENPPTLYQATIIKEDIKPFRHTVSEIEYTVDQVSKMVNGDKL